MRPAPRKWYASMRFGTYSTLTHTRAFLNICIHLLSLHAQHHRARCACTYTIINTALALSSTPRILFIMRRISLAKSLFRQQHVRPQLSRSTHYTDLHTARHTPPATHRPAAARLPHQSRIACGVCRPYILENSHCSILLAPAIRHQTPQNTTPNPQYTNLRTPLVTGVIQCSVFSPRNSTQSPCCSTCLPLHT